MIFENNAAPNIEPTPSRPDLDSSPERRSSPFNIKTVRRRAAAVAAIEGNEKRLPLSTPPEDNKASQINVA